TRASSSGSSGGSGGSGSSGSSGGTGGTGGGDGGAGWGGVADGVDGSRAGGSSSLMALPYCSSRGAGTRRSGRAGATTPRRPGAPAVDAAGHRMPPDA